MDSVLLPGSDMELHRFVESLKSSLGDDLLSVTLFGPSVHLVNERSSLDDRPFVEFPLLIVVRMLGSEQLEMLAPAMQQWKGANQPRPLLFTSDCLRSSADSFPVELLDMKEARKVLYGEDSILSLEVKRTYFQQQLVYALKQHLLEARGELLELTDDDEGLRFFLLKARSRLSLLLRSTLRLYMPVCPTNEQAILEGLQLHIQIDLETFSRIDTFRAASNTGSLQEVRDLCKAYVRQIEAIVEGVDRLKVRRSSVTYPPFRS